jgi:hypothetical protein
MKRFQVIEKSYVSSVLEWPCGGIGRRAGLRTLVEKTDTKLSALGEILGVEPPKFGEDCKMLMPSQALERNLFGRCRD